MDKNKNRNKIFVSGYFNTLHPGHIRLLKFAKSLGNELVVGIISKKIISDKTYNSDNSRIETLKSINFIDQVILIDSSLEKTLLKVKPNVIVKGREHENTINTENKISHEAVYILDTITENKYKKISNKNNYYMKLLDEYVEKEYDYMFKDKNVDDDFFKAKNPPYYKPTKSLILPASYYKSYHREALHLEHVEKDTIEVAEGYSGKYLLGKKNGYGTIKYKSGDIYKGEFKMDLFNGVGEYTWANGLIYNGDWKDGKKNGKGTLTHPSGEKYSGDFKDDKKHGKGYYINPNGMNYDGGYKNDMFHGKGKFVDATGKVIEGTFKEGKLIK